ncbi:hypothetical protein, partial [Pseudomonas mosselii]|uniref:hypothetical protein n=1 Tax=Pseudomonas mosselii TaxID=78327 RepID=UPI001BD4A1C9
MEQDSPRSAISQALAVLPVAVPESWAMSALSGEELATMSSWSSTSIAMTFASLYLTEFMDHLSSNELRRLREYITGNSSCSYEEQGAFYG